MDAGEKYLAHMGKYQVISLSLKSMKQYSYELSYNMLQKAVEVQPGDTPETLQKRVMVEAEWQLLPKAIAMVCNGEV